MRIFINILLLVVTGVFMLDYYNLLSQSIVIEEWQMFAGMTLIVVGMLRLTAEEINWLKRIKNMNRKEKELNEMEENIMNRNQETVVMKLKEKIGSEQLEIEVKKEENEMVKPDTQIERKETI